MRAQAYDLTYNGTELGGGSIRISDPRMQSRVFSLLGIDDATAQIRFGFLLEGPALEHFGDEARVLLLGLPGRQLE